MKNRPVEWYKLTSYIHSVLFRDPEIHRFIWRMHNKDDALNKIKKELNDHYQEIKLTPPKSVKTAEGTEAFEITFSGTLKERN